MPNVSLWNIENCDMDNCSKQEILDRRYLDMARIWAQNSYCKRRKVGALLVKDKMIISDGYNGTPSGFPNVCEDENGITHPYVLHAEANAITKVAQSNNSSAGSTLYVTASPCMECSKLIIQAGITRVVFSEMYRLNDGLKLLESVGIETVWIPEENAGEHTAETSCASGCSCVSPSCAESKSSADNDASSIPFTPPVC